MAAAYRTSAAGGGTSGTTDRTAAITGVIGDLFVVFCTVSGNTQAAPTCTDNQGGNYDLIGTALWGTSANIMSVFVRNDLVLSAVSHTVTVATGSNTAGEIVVVAVSGMQRVGADAVRQSKFQANQASATPAPAFNAAVLTANVTLGAVTNSSAAPIMTEPTGWTERQDLGQITPTTSIEVVSRDSGFTGTTVTWGSSSGTAFADVILELDGTAGQTSVRWKDVSNSGLNRSTNVPGATGTMCGWIRLGKGTGTNQGFFGVRLSDDTQFISFSINSDGTSGCIRTAAGATNLFTPAIGAWYFVALVWSGTTLTGYFSSANGSGGTLSNGTIAITSRAYDKVTFGILPTGSQLNGNLRELRIWDAALSSAELQSEMFCTSPYRAGSGSNINSHFPFVTTTSNAHLTDMSGNGFNLTADSSAPTTDVTSPSPLFLPRDEDQVQVGDSTSRMAWQFATSQPAAEQYTVLLGAGDDAAFTPATPIKPDEDFWVNAVAPVPPSLWQSLPVGDKDEIPAGALFGVPNEDHPLPAAPWPALPLQAPPIVPSDDLPVAAAVSQVDDDFRPSQPPIASAWLLPGVVGDRDEIPAGALFGVPHEDYWINGVAPVPATLFLILPTKDPDEIPAGGLFGVPEEVYWINPVAPIPAMLYQPLPAKDPEELPAGQFYGQADEDFWRNHVAPAVAQLYQRLPIGDVEELPAGALFGQADEDFWRNMVAPVLAAIWQRLPVGDQEELPSGALFGGADEDIAPPQRPAAPPPYARAQIVDSDQPSSVVADDDLGPSALPVEARYLRVALVDPDFAPAPGLDEDFWQAPIITLPMVARVQLQGAEDLVFALGVDEDYWINQVAPSAASLYQPLPFLVAPDVLAVHVVGVLLTIELQASQRPSLTVTLSAEPDEALIGAHLSAAGLYTASITAAADEDEALVEIDPPKPLYSVSMTLERQPS